MTPNMADRDPFVTSTQGGHALNRAEAPEGTSPSLSRLKVIDLFFSQKLMMPSYSKSEDMNDAFVLSVQCA